MHLPECLSIAKLIHIKDLQQKTIQFLWKKVSAKKTNPYNILLKLEVHSLLSPELQNSTFRIKLLEDYFSKCKSLNEEFHSPMSDPPCNPSVYKDIVTLTFDSANKEEKLSILLGIAKNMKHAAMFDSMPLFEAIRDRASSNLQKTFFYALLNQTLREYYYGDLSAETYENVLAFFMPVDSICDKDIKELTKNVLIKEQPSFNMYWSSEWEPHMIADPSYKDPFYHDYDYGRRCSPSLHHMCQAVLNSYMPCQQIPVEKKNLMLETIICNKSLSKDFRKKIIQEYVQDEEFTKYLLSIVEHGQSSRRLMKTKSAAKSDLS